MMNRRTFLSATLFHFSAGVLFACTILPVRAQPPGGGFFGGQMNEMIFKMRQSRAFADPGISNTANLLTRPDVSNELMLNRRQTEALTELQNGYPAAMMQQMQDTFKDLFQNAGAVNFQEMSAEERQEFGEQMRNKVQQVMSTVQADQDKKSEAALAPSQLKRLHELDLQWRGPLALADGKISDKFNLIAEQTAKLTALLKEYRKAQDDARAAMFGGPRPGAAAGGPGQNDANKNSPEGNGARQPPAGGAPPATGANPPAGGPPAAGGFGNFHLPSAEELQERMMEADKQTLKLRKTTDAKVLALLTPQQQQLWKTVQGKPFTFRTNL